MITQTINLNLIPGSPLPRINVSQYDNGSRTLQFNLYNGVSPYEIPSGASVYIVGTKADNTGFEYSCTFDGSLVSVDITDQMTVFAGEVQSELRIVQSDEVLGTANFIINVESAALSDDTQISETDIPIIQRIPEILEEAEGYADDAKYWAEQSEEAVTGAVTYGYNGIMGAKNLLGQPYYGVSSAGGLTFSVDSDGVLKINGTATSNAEYVFKANANNWCLPTGKYKVSGISGGSSNTYYMSVQVNGGNIKIIYDGETEIDVTSTDYIRISVGVKSGQTVNDLQIFPMVRIASDTDTTFRPYAKTNKELTDGLNTTHGNYYGTCATAAATAAKVVTVDEDFKLAVGTTVTVKFTNTNTASNCTLNVNGTGAKSVWYGQAVYSSAGGICGTANRYIKYMYDGTYWVWIGWSTDNGITEPYSLGFGYGTCANEESTVAKVVTLANYVLKNGGYVSVKFTNGVPANATMNINSRGAKPIYYHGSAITAGIIKAGDVATFIYNGSQYVLTGVDSLSTRVGNLETEMGTSDISAIGDGTVTGGISQLNSDLTTLLQWSSPVNNIANVPATAHDIQVNTIVADSGALGSILIPYNAYGTYIFGGWDGNYAILEYQANLFDISLYLNGTTYQHRAYIIVYR